VVFLATLAVASCGPTDPGRVTALGASATIAADTETWGTTVVVLAIDGARWQEVFRGVDAELGKSYGLASTELLDARALVPNLAALLEGYGAALGAPEVGGEMRASGPNFVSLPGYSEILSGRGPSGCKDNSCAGPSEPTVIDDLTARHGCSPGSVAVVTSWPDIGRVAAQRAECATISSGRHGGHHHEHFRTNRASTARFEADARADPFPGQGDFRPDHLTGSQALGFLERYEPRFLFVGLGETDEYGHRADYRGYLDALNEADRWVGSFAQALSRMALRGRRTALFVTTDHGRASSFADHGAAYPESARVWLIAGGTEITRRAWRGGAHPRRLADLIPTVRHLLGLAPDRSERAGTPLVELLTAGVQD
jgi:hypothetical protein